jgi:CheY-like chemotaxis protein
MLVNRLRRHGYELIVAGDGAQGIAMARDHAPSLILMDLSLPVLDGWEATRRLKATPETRTIPVIALSAHVCPGTAKPRWRPDATIMPSSRSRLPRCSLWP